jgi:hypothetical protein
MQTDPNATEWNDLPTNVWYYEAQGIESARPIQQLLIANLNATAAE